MRRETCARLTEYLKGFLPIVLIAAGLFYIESHNWIWGLAALIAIILEFVVHNKDR